MSFVRPIFVISIFLIVLMNVALAQEATNTKGTEESEEEQTTQEQQALTELKKIQEQLSGKEGELTTLDNKINELSSKHNTATNQAELAADQLARISKQLQTSELQLQQTLLSISVTQTDITKTSEDISQVHEDIAARRELLRKTMRSLYQYDSASLMNIILNTDKLSTILNEQHQYQILQDKVLGLVNDLHQKQIELIEQKDLLIEHKDKQDQLRTLQIHQQDDLSDQRATKKDFLSLKQQEKANYQNKITEAKQARTEIKQQIFKLKSVDLEISITDAYSAARFASSITGVRPALLLAVLKVETNVGEWLGSGKFPDDMHPGSRDAFLRLTEKIGLDPYTAPISRRPASYKGWGGAMGPGQFMPATWEGIESRVSALMKKPQPNPYELADAIVGTGIMLADRGATSRQKEFEAVNRYLAGPNWLYHTWYGKRVLAVAKEYEAEGLE
jgi:peptidoglycan hydrolase CwlO-like protein